MERHNFTLSDLISSKMSIVDDELTNHILGLIDYLPSPIVLEVLRCSQTVLASRLEPKNCETMEGFISTHRKVIGLLLEALD